MERLLKNAAVAILIGGFLFLMASVARGDQLPDKYVHPDAEVIESHVCGERLCQTFEYEGQSWRVTFAIIRKRRSPLVILYRESDDEPYRLVWLSPHGQKL